MTHSGMDMGYPEAGRSILKTSINRASFCFLFCFYRATFVAQGFQTNKKKIDVNHSDNMTCLRMDMGYFQEFGTNRKEKIDVNNFDKMIHSKKTCLVS